MQVLGIDAGNFETKIVHEKGYESFVSTIGEWRKRTVTDIHSKQDMEFHIVNKYENFKGFAGPLAGVESEYGGTVFGVSKNHQDANTRILLAIWRNLTESNVSIVVGQPYKSHNDDEKNEIIRALEGEHSVTVNGHTKKFNIINVRVGIEGAMAFLSQPQDGPCNIIDVGSGTVNCIHFLNRRIVDRRCDTLPFGSETSKSGANFEGMANGIFKNMSGVWDKNHPTLVCGGSSDKVIGPLKKYYPMAQVMQPTAKMGVVTMRLSPSFANAIGMYNVGLKVFTNDKVQTS